ncbi:hypothetical protein [Pseudochelatococcus contaminans]|uniref:hypothetical protein n=1 Tax=Pseudochelatococcus contaminans TaxID=1538103 RepID=UPI001AED63A9|nr:hypothetical protein [Pseudochelatococcus contaminans]
MTIQTRKILYIDRKSRKFRKKKPSRLSHVAAKVPVSLTSGNMMQFRGLGDPVLVRYRSASRAVSG